jgi:hypothetical protein
MYKTSGRFDVIYEICIALLCVPTVLGQWTIGHVKEMIKYTFKFFYHSHTSPVSAI